ncbi:Possible membrane protein [hydrothermal vent metagenome]|uniref:Possible membrane protein n=1 Tax=hydrothermal vent metagenome TaxID=652676 RepID=A0A1W1EAL0_9ZZZZ
MNEILLNNEVIVYLFSETLLYLLLFIAFVLTIGVLRRWNFDAFTTEQFALENRSYLVITIIFFAMLLKILLLPYFVYTIDTLSDLIPGAMCGAGVIKANSYGNPLLSIKIVVLFLSGLWLSLNALDLQAKNYPYTIVKSWFFVVIFLFLSAEYLLDILYFTHIETTKPVSCCSVIFGQIGGSADSLPFGLDIPKLLILFYLLFALSLLTIVAELSVVSIFASLFFLVISYYAVVYFFGTYIYQLPTHKCPFCMLQDHYFYVGYLVWGSLLLGVFYALDSAAMKLFFGHTSQRLKRVSLLFLTFFVLLCSAYVVIYYLKNGVLL